MRPIDDLEQQLKLLGNALRARPRLVDRVMKKLVPIPGEVFEPVSLNSTTERVGMVKPRRARTKSRSGLSFWANAVLKCDWPCLAAAVGLLVLLFFVSLAAWFRHDSPPKPPTSPGTSGKMGEIQSGPAPG